MVRMAYIYTRVQAQYPWREMVQIDGTHDSTGKTDAKVVPKKHREKKLVTTEASAEYVINPVLYAEFNSFSQLWVTGAQV